MPGGNPEHVGSHQDVQRLPRRNNWTISSDEALVDLLLEESKQPGVCSGSFRPEAWFRIWNEYQKRTKEDTTLPQLKGRWKTLKKLYKLHSSLVGKSGWSWDFDTQRPTPGCPMVWEVIIKVSIICIFSCNDRFLAIMESQICIKQIGVHKFDKPFGLSQR